MAPENHPNRLLASLTKADFELVRPHLKPITLAKEAIAPVL